MTGVCGSPRCGGRLVSVQYGDGQECEVCGWSPPKAGRRDRQRTEGGKDYHDGKCDMHYEGSRCPLPGTLSPNIREGGPWYCRYHWPDGNRQQDDIQREFFQDYAWARNAAYARAQLLARWYPRRGEMERSYQQWLAEHPEVFRRDGEGKSEYLARMRGPVRQMMAAQITRSDEMRDVGGTTGGG